MAQIPVTIPMIFVRRMLSGVRLAPREFERHLYDAGIRQEQLSAEDACVTADQYIALFSTMIKLLDDEGLGFFSRPLKYGSFALIARSAASAPTLALAIRRAAHTCRLLQDDVRMASVREGELAGVQLRFARDQSVINDAAHEFLLRAFWRLFAWLIGGRLPAARFDFAFPRASWAESYDPIFPGQKRFECEHSALWFDAKWLEAPVCRDAQALHEFLSRSFAEIIVPTRDEGVGGRVRRFLQQSQPAWPDLAHVAAALHMATSTLQRRLAAEGLTFQELKNNLRRDIAIFRLQTSEVSLGRLATELGFADNAAFQRAFKLWTGSPPGVYQRKISSGKRRKDG